MTKQERIEKIEAELAILKQEVAEEVSYKPWKPEKGDTCYFVWSNTTEAMWDGYDREIGAYENGFVFETGEEADTFLEKQKLVTAINRFIDEKNEGWEPDWININEGKVTFYFDGRKWRASTCWGGIFQFSIRHAKSEEIIEQVIENFDLDILLK